MTRPGTMSIDRILWDSVVSLLTRLEEGGGGESLQYFQGAAGAVLDNIRDKRPDVVPARRAMDRGAP